VKLDLEIIDNLPFVQLKVSYKGKIATLNYVIVDTGSGSCILKNEAIQELGIKPKPEDSLGLVKGVGGSEYVFIKRLDYLSVGNLRLDNFTVDIGEMDYGFRIQGIIGMDFLLETGAVIDLSSCRCYNS
jgi:predicted aspartyl protease